MKRLLVFACLFMPLYLQGATTHYVDGAVSSSGNGLSWATAWKAFSNITGLAAGDTVYISGGTTSQSYTLTDWTPVGGTSGNPITYSVGQDAGHTGVVTIVSSDSFLNGSISNVVINGNFGGAQHWSVNPSNYFWETGTGTNVTLEYIVATNMGAGIHDVQGSSIEVSHCSLTKDNNSANIHDFIFYAFQGNSAHDVKVHDSYIQFPVSTSDHSIGDDMAIWPINMDFYNNTVVGQNRATYSWTQHSDVFQTNQESNMIIHDNVIINPGESVYYQDNQTTGTVSNIQIYNNLIMRTASTNGGAERIFDMNPESSGANTTDYVDVVIANNDIIDHNGIFWCRFLAVRTLTRVYLVNNIVYPSDTGTSIQSGVTVANNSAGAVISFVSYTQYAGTSNDLHLVSGDTSLIGQGTNMSAYFTTDHDGNTRTVPWDIGAYKFGTVNYTLTVSTAGAGSGTLSGTNCSTGSYASGTTITCTQSASGGSVFAGWSGGSCSGTGSCSFSLTANATVTGTFDLLGPPYYISPTGNDSNVGTINLPWLSPNHALNGGDIIYGEAGTYSAANFYSGKWGTVTTSKNFAHLICSTFDTCKINVSTTTYGMYVDKSYWEVEGWEVSTTSTGFTCFAAAPAVSSPVNIDHVIFANDIANGCGGGGFSTFNVTTHGIDYVAFVGDIAYNAAQNNTQCYSGMTMYQPLASDTNAETHLYVGGNFMWGNVEPSTCAGGANQGGDGWISDTFDGSQGLGTQYGQQLLVEQNLLVGNGGYGIQHQTFTKNPAVHPTVYWRHNTSWGNLTNTTFNTNLCIEMLVNLGYGINADHNISQPNVATACTSHTVYAAYAYDTSTATSTIATNWFYAPSGSGTTTGTFNDDGNTFSFGTNTAGSPPVSAAFTAPAVPSAPSCGSASSVPNCMATVIANFVPTASGTTGFGVQAVSGSDGGDLLFPRWVCGQIPVGLVTESCINTIKMVNGNARISGKVQ